jgi:uncharacterized protein YjbI with pentapeptide repeats
LNNLTGGDFSGQDLTRADFSSSTLTNANLAGAMVTGAGFSNTTSRGFTKEQLYSTVSYQQRNLRGIGLGYNDLTGWDFSGQDLAPAYFGYSTLTNANLSETNLAGADFFVSTLTNANLTGAMVTGASFAGVTGFTKEQLYSTANYQQKDLRGIGLTSNDLSGWDFSGQDLRNANFSGSRLTNANLSGANLTYASFWRSTLTNANLSGTILAGADFVGSQLTNADFSFADLRGVYGGDGWSPKPTTALARNTIREFGAINGLDLAAGETLVVRDSHIGITVNDSMNAVSGGTLELVLGDANWGSTMAVAAGVTPDLGGTLRVRFADQANLAPLLGKTFDFFDWPGVLETNNRFDAIELPPGTQWDLTQLYVTGTAKLTALLLGDYNRDGTVDAADYVVWRNGLGTTYTQADYDVWRANFGQTAGGGAALSSAEPLPAIPEPSTALIAFVGSLALAARCGRTHVRLRR